MMKETPKTSHTFRRREFAPCLGLQDGHNLSILNQTFRGTSLWLSPIFFPGLSNITGEFGDQIGIDKILRDTVQLIDGNQ